MDSAGKPEMCLEDIDKKIDREIDMISDLSKRLDKLMQNCTVKVTTFQKAMHINQRVAELQIQLCKRRERRESLQDSDIKALCDLKKLLTSFELLLHSEAIGDPTEAIGPKDVSVDDIRDTPGTIFQTLGKACSGKTRLGWPIDTE